MMFRLFFMAAPFDQIKTGLFLYEFLKNVHSSLVVKIMVWKSEASFAAKHEFVTTEADQHHHETLILDASFSISSSFLHILSVILAFCLFVSNFIFLSSAAWCFSSHLLSLPSFRLSWHWGKIAHFIHRLNFHTLQEKRFSWWRTVSFCPALWSAREEFILKLLQNKKICEIELSQYVKSMILSLGQFLWWAATQWNVVKRSSEKMTPDRSWTTAPMWQAPDVNETNTEAVWRNFSI